MFEVAGSEPDAQELVFSRVFAAPAVTVFRAWTDPKQLVRWWGPRDFSLTINTMDVTVGGIWDYVLHGPDGMDYPNRAVFEEVDPPIRLVFFNSGGHVSDRHLTCRMVVTFEDKVLEGNGMHTLVTLRMQFETSVALDRAKARGAEEGGQESFARLSEWLKCRGPYS
ncbi:MAG: SRPBCC domain-containing protein [Roseibium sp.]|uniref:SRPBCC domain-containing protein n=1 Tax=Roseibium sp. TaxID=1936156 RepID=UPI00262D6C17|nr:SRPBCC domain-containing protein [Roseibium sp.]MCV0426329.1 SRPBCC domain-containing protein [Roseibium sp.]